MSQISSLPPLQQSDRPRRCVVTGAAGFIGSRLAERLLEDGWQVVGIDGFTDTYDPSEKLDRASALVRREGFSLAAGHMADMPLEPVLEGAEVVFHLAGRAGVRPSFDLEPRYVVDNVDSATALVNACKVTGVRRIVYASSSSVYGNAETPFSENGPTGPISPYGRTKLEAERICLGATAEGTEATALRYFTVYGPGQRPDMGIRIFAEAALERRPIRLFGDGSQRRDFTYVDDIVEATTRAADAPVSGMAINVGGGSSVTLSETLELLERIVGHPLQVRHEAFARGDVRATAADLTRATTLLGFKSSVPFERGLAEEVCWVQERLATSGRCAA
ncbi:MAG: NAD-dependent epimerase/dehydratase family protein [Actinomycetota bacterium]|nr:NAD-dependent epimerase/dehydratase family protein [Actinomycetota bacterium]